MKIFSYAMLYAFIAFLFYLFIQLFRFAFVHIKAYVIRRKLSKVADSENERDTEKKDG